MVNASEWMYAEVLAARGLAAEKLLSTHLHLWPTKKYLEDDMFRHIASAKTFELRDDCLVRIHKEGGGNTKNLPEWHRKIAERVLRHSPLSRWLTRRTIAVSLKGRRGARGIPGELSSDQVFFMTVCYMKCTLPGAVGPQTVGCNRAV
ncbi:hypothetical protein MRX96_012855 [Rhipicephalus microplus]